MAGKLRTQPNVEDPDGFYAQLIELHQGLTPEQSQKLNAKLILMLANHIGDREVLDEICDCFRSARSAPGDG
ncbi:MAG: DUF2783 domain-containing protein [Gammaproteobacteria bacterium]|nr:DUF2783 domain-containing protein [Gammaproteobacteria bacterium]